MIGINIKKGILASLSVLGMGAGTYLSGAFLTWNLYWMCHKSFCFINCPIVEVLDCFIFRGFVRLVLLASFIVFFLAGLGDSK